MTNSDISAIRSELIHKTDCIACFLLAMSDFVKAAGHIMTQEELAGFAYCIEEARGKQFLIEHLDKLEAGK